MNDDDGIDSQPLMSAPHGRQDDDQKMISLANLQAMLGIEDIGEALELMQQNDWDETVSAPFMIIGYKQAANAFYAKQHSRPPRESAQ